MSPSSRRAWIEIHARNGNSDVVLVALLAEGVDRNMGENDTGPWAQTVALLAEGVDRNLGSVALFLHLLQSPSSRRAWIEIRSCGQNEWCGGVALLAEGVDRNWAML